MAACPGEQCVAIDRLLKAALIAGDSTADIRLEVSQIEVAQAKEIGASGGISTLK